MSKTVITTVRETTWDISSSATFTDTFTLSNLGPLTTTFTPPSDCLNTWYVTDFHLELGVHSRTDCFPPGFTPGNAITTGYFSPGRCPSSYTGAITLSLWWTAVGRFGLQCCPSGYILPSAVTASCFTTLSSTVTTSITDGTLVRVTGFSEIWAPAIPVLWNSQNQFIAATQTGSNTNPKTEPSPGGSVSHSLPASSTTAIAFGPTSLDGDSTSGLNHTTMIALATVIPIVLIALAIAAFIFLRRRSRLIAAAAAIDTTVNGLPELEGNADDGHKPGARYWPAPIELPSIPAPVELPARATRPSELPAAGTPPSEPVTTPVIPAVLTRAPPADVITPVATPQDDQEMEWLNRELERVNERRENLRKLEALNDEHSQLQRRINERLSGGRAEQ